MSDVTTTFLDNMSLPIHRWYRFTAGFSAEWVKDLVRKSLASGNDSIVVMDPFAGSGTTLLACDELGIESYGYEAQPMISQIAKAKLSWDFDVKKFINLAERILLEAEQETSPIDNYPAIIGKCYDEDRLKDLDHLKKALYAHKDESIEYRLCWMALVCIIRKTSHAGTATWQYILPNNTKAKVAMPFDAFKKQVQMMANDMELFQKNQKNSLAHLYHHDGRLKSEIPDSTVDLVITSPPYANNYDYADCTRLESSFLGNISSWGDLKQTRDLLVRSCSQAVSKQVKETFVFLEDELLKPIHDEIVAVCNSLKGERENHGGKKNYHTMVALYFLDMAKIWVELRRICKPGAKVCFVVGDSAPYGVYVPVDEWLGKLAVAAGFKSYWFEKTRDRNIKWKNRKHRVPLKEGRLWIEG